MRNNKKCIVTILFFFTIVFGGILSVNACTEASSRGTLAALTDGKIKIGTGKISATVSLGYKGKSKYGKYIRADVVVENGGGDFAGKFRVQYVSSDKEAMVQKSFAVASGESKKVQFALPYIESGSSIRVALCDEDDKIVCDKWVAMDSDNDVSQLYIGTLSDSQDTMKHLTNALISDEVSFGTGSSELVYELAYEDITEDAKMLDSLDVIVINDFDTGRFSKGQTDAIKKWVMGGGSLVLGSGANADKVLKAFSGELFQGTAGSVTSIKTNFGVSQKELTRLHGESLLNKKVPVDITQLNIQGSKAVLADGEEKLMCAKDYGKGNVLVSEFSLALEGKASQLYSAVVAETIKENLSEARKNDMGNTNSQAVWQSALYEKDTLLLNETDSLPNLKLYAVILVIYVILAGPVAYIFTKKKDKRNLLWFVVPVLSVTFSIIVYLIGTATRIQKPYINYISTIELPEQGSASNHTNTIFSITSSSNNPFQVKAKNGSDILPADINQDIFMYNQNWDDDEYNYGVEYGADSTKLIMNRLSSFESAYFKMNHKSTSDGTVEINVEKKDEKLSGFINNKMSCDLEDCIFYHNGTMYYIGDFPAGRAFDMSTLPEKDIYKESSYAYDFESQTSAALGGGLYDNGTDNTLKRKVGMILTFVSVNQTDSTWFYGFVANESEKGFTDSITYDKYGETGVYKYAEISEKTGGYDVIGSLEKYAYQFNENQTDGYNVYSDSNGKLEVTYKFPENFTLKKIIYNKETASGGEYSVMDGGYTETAFLGTAMVKDKETGKNVTLLEAAKDAEIDNMEQYLEADGSLTIYYAIDINSSANIDRTDSFILPGVKLAGVYKSSEKNKKVSNE